MSLLDGPRRAMTVRGVELRRLKDAYRASSPGLRHRARRETRRRHSALDADDVRPRVVVLSMPKSGSTSLAVSLEQVGFSTLQIHFLDRGWLRNRYREYLSDGVLPRTHVTTAMYVRKRLLPVDPAQSLRVVATVREPIARDIADHFQVAERRGYSLSPEPSDVLQPAMLDWFDVHVRPHLGIDVFAEPFDTEQGFQIYRAPGIELLVMRQESLRSEPLSVFLGAEVDLIHANSAESKPYADAYRAYVSSVTFDPVTVDRVYSSQFARHFYSDEERAALRLRWAG